MIPLPRRILIADHHAERLPDLRRRLAGHGHTLLSTTDAAATMEVLSERRPDLVLLSPLAGSVRSDEIQDVLEAKDRVQRTPLLLVCDELPDAEVVRRLAGLVDDVLLRGELSEELLTSRIQLALGRLSHLRRLEQENLALERQSITDFKTGTFNDRYFHRRLREEFSRARRHRCAISCVMLDFDNFKEINDSFDHAFGDFVLLSFAKKLKAEIREIDIPARLGGDEFVLLLPNTEIDEAVRIAERIRRIVAAYSFEREGRSTTVSLSIGISSFDGVEDATPEEFLRRADCSLLEAKRRGRNRTVLYPQIADGHPRAPHVARERRAPDELEAESAG